MVNKTKEFIKKAKEIHGDKYDYSKTEYKKVTEKVCIICPKHGEFWQTPQVHLRGSDCPKCGLEKIKEKNTKTKENFLKEAKLTHGDKYDYSKVEYITNLTPVCIICPEHGEFWQVPQVHLRGSDCPKCAVKNRTKSKESFIEQSNIVHNNKYDYSKVEYVNSHKKVCIICPEHGEFWQAPYNHLNGNGCPKCKIKNISDKRRKTTEQFIHEAKLIHHDKYSYEKTRYMTSETSAIITCPVHGDFLQRPHDHMDGHGCPKCANQQSLAEDEIYNHIQNILGKENVKRRVGNILNDKRELDIFIPKKKIGIEFNGLYWHSEKYGKDRFYHLRKTNDFNALGINVLQIFEDEWDNNKTLILNKIDHIFGNQNSFPKIFGRKCIIKTISKDEAETFLNKNHIQGFVNSSVYVGAFYNQKLVGVTSFTEEHEKSWNLTRMATDINYICNGVCGKMLSFFKKNFTWKEIKTFADRRWTLDKDNNLYTKLGFEFSKTLPPDYRYIVGKKRIHKFNFRKQNLHEKYGLSLSMTEYEMTQKLGFYRIWDCGLFKYTIKNDN